MVLNKLFLPTEVQHKLLEDVSHLYIPLDSLVALACQYFSELDGEERYLYIRKAKITNKCVEQKP